MTDFDMVVPIPTHWFRKFRKGFQAADIICEAVSQLTEIPKPRNIIWSTRTTKKQGTLSNRGRFTNVRGAFTVSSKANLEEKRILIVDDVMTSGATASEAARILKRAGAKSVCVAVVARGARVS